jgi:hypothetical protein
MTDGAVVLLDQSTWVANELASMFEDQLGESHQVQKGRCPCHERSSLFFETTVCVNRKRD